jgi:hypothetical protein
MKKWQFLGILSLALCISYALYSGVIKTLEPVQISQGLYAQGKHLDGHLYYVAGKTWLAGQSPYDFNTFLFFWKKDLEDSDYHQTREYYKNFLKEGHGAFIYPPTIGLFSIPLALFSWTTAQIILDIANIVALLSILFFSIKLTERFLPTAVESGKIWLGIGMSGFMSAVPSAIYTGQSPLLVTMGFLGTIYFYLRGHIVIAALFVIIASLKPQLSFLPLIYLLILAGSWQLIAWSILFVGIVAMGVLMIGGDYNLLSLVQNLLVTHLSLKPNTGGGLPGIYWFVSQISTQHSLAFMLSIIGILLIIGFTMFFKHRYQNCFIEYTPEFVRTKTLILLFFYLSLVTLLMPQHLFDHVVLMPLFALLWVMRWQFAVFLLPGLLLVSRPNNIVHLLRSFVKVDDLLITSQMIASFGILWITIFFATVFFFFANSVISEKQE